MSRETPLTKQYKSIKSRYPDCFLFFRLGDFYELFGEDAIKASKLMEVTLTKRQGTPMCGVPYHSASGYIKKLLNHSKSIAVCEQVEEASKSKGIVKREVVRVITPGTVIEDELLSNDENNFLLSIAEVSGEWGVVFLDISTGDFMGSSFKRRASLEAEISRFPVREALISQDNDELREMLKLRFPEISVTERDGWYFTPSKAEEEIKEYFKIATVKGWELDRSPSAEAACGALVSYIRETGKGKKSVLKNFRFYTSDRHMVLDRNTQENLELLKNLQDRGKKNTLFGILDFTATSMGKRKLARWIARPLKETGVIRKRLNSVQELCEDAILSSRLGDILKSVNDMERIISRAGFGSSNARDLVALRDSLNVIPDIKKLLKKTEAAILKEIAVGLDEMKQLSAELQNSLVDSPPLAVKEGGMIKKGYSKELDALIEQSGGDKKWVSALQEKERKRLKIPSLKVGYNKVHGYYIEVTKTHVEKVPEDYTRKQTLVNAERYITGELKARENSILGAEEKKCALEYSIFSSLRQKVCSLSETIQMNADLIARLDALNSFASASVKYSYVKPRVDDGKIIKIKDGRHPLVERNLPVNEFVPNDAFIESGRHQILVITGPNMAGKSTYLKQVALITIMAQMGCFVPAGEARIGIADRIFTRIGAGENLAAGESTFMVEMTEVAAILSSATEKSLLIMDEVGRGTSTFDGISIAWAVLEKIDKMGSRTLFATHYFELTEMAGCMDSVKNYHFSVREWKDKRKIVFLRKLNEGSADKSYGIHCAELAGVPGEVIKRAWDIFRKLEEEEYNSRGYPRPVPRQNQDQMGLFEYGDRKYRAKLKELNLEEISPLELMNIIKDLQEQIKSED